MRRGAEDAYYTDKLFDLRDAMEAVGMYYQIIEPAGPPAGAPVGPPANIPADAILPEEPKDNDTNG